MKNKVQKRNHMNELLLRRRVYKWKSPARSLQGSVDTFVLSLTCLLSETKQILLYNYLVQCVLLFAIISKLIVILRGRRRQLSTLNKPLRHFNIPLWPAFLLLHEVFNNHVRFIPVIVQFS